MKHLQQSKTGHRAAIQIIIGNSSKVVRQRLRNVSAHYNFDPKKFDKITDIFLFFFKNAKQNHTIKNSV